MYNLHMKSYILKVELQQDQDGRWNAVVPSLRACYTWGNTRAEALAHIQDAARCCIEEMLAHGEPVPADVEAVDTPVTAVVV